MDRPGSRRMLVLAIPLAALAGLGWWLASGRGDAGAALEPARAADSVPRTPQSDALELPEHATTGERIATGSGAAIERTDAPGAAQPQIEADEPLAGAIRGELLREGGAWTEATLPPRGSVLIDLVPLAGPKLSRRAELASEPDGRGGIRLRFEFADLPRGEYELTLSSLAAWRWHPTTLRVSPPIDNVTFLRYDLDRCSPLSFHVTDRASGRALESYELRTLQLTPSQDNGVFLHTGPLPTEAVPEDARFQWSLWSEGYRPAFGDESAFVRQGAARVAEIALEQGWATKALVLMRDPTLKPAFRAEVWLDGRPAGLTDRDGMLAVLADEPPAKFEVRLPGWHMTNDPLQPYNGKSAAQRGQVTIVILEKTP
jgi:hypothetical protein